MTTTATAEETGGTFGTLGFGLYLLFVTSWFTHLTARVPALGVARFDLLLIAAVAGCAAMQPRQWSSASIAKLIAALTVYAVLTVPLVEWPGTVFRFGLEKLAKAVVFYFFTAALVTTSHRLKMLVTVFTLAQVFRFLEPLYLHETEGYWGSMASTADWGSMQRLSGAPLDVVNPNGLAFVILTAICFMHFLWSRTAIGRLAYLCALPLAVYTLTLTGSRSGMIGLLSIFLVVVAKSRRKAVLLTVAALAIVFALPRLGPDLADRYLSIVDSTARNAGSAEGRVEGVMRDLRVAMRRPLFGHGLGTSREANANFGGNDQPSHNLYTEVAQEIGFLGLILFVAILYTVATNLYTTLAIVRSRPQAEDYLKRLTDALQVWLALNLVFSLASYGLTSYEWYLMAGLSEVVRRLASKNNQQIAVTVEPSPSRHPMLAGVGGIRVA
jgi:O-antigen ligase